MAVVNKRSQPKPSGKNETGSGSIDALSQLMYQAWLRQQQQQKQPKPRTSPAHQVSDGSSYGRNANHPVIVQHTPVKRTTTPVKRRTPRAGSQPSGNSGGPGYRPAPPPGPSVPAWPTETSILASVPGEITDLAAGMPMTPLGPDLGSAIETIPIADQGPLANITPEAPDLGTGIETIPVADQNPGQMVKAAEGPTGYEQLPLFDEGAYRVAGEAGDAGAVSSGTTFGSGQGPHTISVMVTRDGEVVSSGTLESGDMTPEEAALGFPQSTLATHTEVRAVQQYPLESGDIMEINGQYPPCPSCKGVMNRAASSQGAYIIYLWPGGKWVANQ